MIHFAFMIEERSAIIRANQPIATSRASSQLGIDERSITEHSSGLLVVNQLDALRASEPELYVRENGMLLPSTAQHPRHIKVASDQEVLDVLSPTLEKKRKQRTPTEMARALSNPQLFLANEIEHTVDDGITLKVEEVLKSLREIDEDTLESIF